MRTRPEATIDVQAKPTPPRVRVLGTYLSIAPFTCIKCQTTTDLPAPVVATTGGPLCEGCYGKILNTRPSA
jgi:hypothetical protein